MLEALTAASSLASVDMQMHTLQQNLARPRGSSHLLCVLIRFSSSSTSWSARAYRPAWRASAPRRLKNVSVVLEVEPFAASDEEAAPPEGGPAGSGEGDRGEVLSGSHYATRPRVRTLKRNQTISRFGGAA